MWLKGVDCEGVGHCHRDAVKDRQKIQASFEQADSEPEWKRMRTYPYEEVEDALLIRSKSTRETVPVSENILQVKAEELARELGHNGFSCSGGWLQHFKNCRGIVQKCICGESAS